MIRNTVVSLVAVENYKFREFDMQHHKGEEVDIFKKLMNSIKGIGFNIDKNR